MLSLNSYNGFDFITCYYLPIDSGSSDSYIDSCNMVSATREAALNTSERISVWSIPFFVMPADRTDMELLLSDERSRGEIVEKALREYRKTRKHE